MAERQLSHTPGPWSVGRKNTTHKNPVIEVLSNHVEAGVSFSLLGSVCDVKGHNEESDANARLIAAAPDMLEALKNLWVDAEFFLDSLDTEEITQPGPAALNASINKVKIIIAKAEGREVRL